MFVDGGTPWPLDRGSQPRAGGPPRRAPGAIRYGAAPRAAGIDAIEIEITLRFIDCKHYYGIIFEFTV